MKIIDSFAWFEYFAGSKRGAFVEACLKSGEPIGTPASCIAEIKRKRFREGKQFAQELAFIKANSSVLPLTEEIALRAGEIKELHFADALVYATAVEHAAIVITGDPHFRAMSNVQLI